MKRIFCLMLTVLLLFTAASCNQQSQLNKVAAVNNMISEIGEITEYDEGKKAELEAAVIAYNALSSEEKHSISTEKLKALGHAMDAQYRLNYANAATNAAIRDIKSDLIRPTSFELNHLLVEVYDTEEKSEYLTDYVYHSLYCEITVDYTAQTQGGGYKRNTETFYIYEGFSDHYRRLDFNLGWAEDYNPESGDIDLRHGTRESLKAEGKLVNILYESDVVWER